MEQHYDTEFFTFKDVGSVAFASRDSEATAGFLVGCFDFFDTRFDWTNEVVSVRMGQRRTTDAACFRNLWGKGQTGFHVEDPIAAQKTFESLSLNGWQLSTQNGQAYHVHMSSKKSNMD